MRGINYEILDDSSCAVSINSNASGDIVIPEKAYNAEHAYNVTVIISGAFMNCTALHSIELTNRIHTIEYGAFQDCINLTSINLNLLVVMHFWVALALKQLI